MPQESATQRQRQRLRLASRWDHIRAGLVETIGWLADGELTFRPYPTAWTVRELLLHIAQEERGERDYGIRQTLAAFPEAYDPAAYPTVTSIQVLLATVHAASVAYLDTLAHADLVRTIETPWGARGPLQDLLEHLIEHETHHRGELSLILGMLGKSGLDA